ncbi:glycosyl hydrolase family 28-related protein [Priestia flexa]|uniref:glycosyl hydrolase family 28-related protein n=1 Tax=Priestia flexa TaxID=86664 RepID=UPI003CFDD2BD
MPRFPYNPFDSSAGFGRQFITWINKVLFDVGLDVKEQKNRIDQQLTSVEQPSEVVDFRIGHDGHVFVTAKERGDASDFRIDDLEERATNSEGNLTKLTEKTSWISVKEFGAKGDGITDDTLAIQNAVDFCINNNISELFFPKGTYYVTGSLEHKGILFRGERPYIPLLAWDYTNPSSTLDNYQTYKNQCRGSIITTDRNISIFIDGLKAIEIGLFGNRRTSNSKGVDSYNGYDEIVLEKVWIVGFSSHGVSAPGGVINGNITKCYIAQNGKNGIFIDQQLNGYKGETNRLYIVDNDIVRNESHGIFGNIKGRHIAVNHNTFEHNGEPSDTNRPKPTNSSNVVYGCFLNLYTTGGFSNGNITFENNYSEETLGLLKLNAVNPTHGISIEDNFWQPISKDYYSCGISLDGWMDKVSILNNALSYFYDVVKFEALNNIKNVKIDIAYTGNPLSMATMESVTNLQTNKVFTNIISSDMKTFFEFPNGLIIQKAYDSSKDLTYFTINKNIAPSFNFGVDGYKNENIGYVLEIDGQVAGFINMYSAGESVWGIRGNRSGLNITSGKAILKQVGGFETTNVYGNKVKLAVDWDDRIINFAK